MEAWFRHATKGEWLEAAKILVLDEHAPHRHGLANTFALIAVAERLDAAEQVDITVIGDPAPRYLDAVPLDPHAHLADRRVR